MPDAPRLGLVLEKQAHSSSSDIYDRHDLGWLYRKPFWGCTMADVLMTKFYHSGPFGLAKFTGVFPRFRWWRPDVLP